MTMQDTSVRAFDSIRHTLANRHLVIVSTMPGREDWSNGELADFLHWPINTVTPRICELRKAGIVEFSQRRPCSITGRTIMAWRIIR